MMSSLIVLALMLGFAIGSGPANLPVAPKSATDANPAAVARAPLGAFSTMDDPPTIEWTFNCEFDSVYNVGVTDVQDSLCWVSAGQVTLQIGIYNIADPTHPFRTAFAQTGGPSGWGIRDMAYKEATDEVFAGFDGQRFHVYNATTHVPNNTYTISGYSGTVRGMAYSPIEDSCWTCNFSTSPMAKFSITGTNGHQVKAAAQMASAYGLALDTNLHCFWMTNAGAAGASPFWKIDYPGYAVSDSFNPTGWGLGGGCEMWRDTFLLALEQATPDMVWCLRLDLIPPMDNDVGVSEIVEPSFYVNPGAVEPKCRVRNFGLNPESDIPVTCWIDSGAFRVYSADARLAGPLGPGQEAEVTFSPSWNTGPVGAEYTVTMFTAYPGDPDPSNDTACSVTRVYGAVFTDTIFVPRTESFEPVFDGVIDPIEWRYAAQCDISDLAGRAGSGPQPAGSAIGYYIYDSTHMYFALDLPRYSGRIDYDQFGLYMDENHDGVWATDTSEGNYWCEYLDGRDTIIYRPFIQWLPGPPQTWDPVPGALQVSSTLSGHLQFEDKIPLGDSVYQITDEPGDTIGFFQYAAVQGGGFFNGWWPQSLLMSQWANPQYYGDMVLETTFVGLEAPPEPRPFAISMVFPSHLRGHASIRYYVGQMGNVTLGLYDAAGSLVKTLVSGVAQAGEHAAVWDLTDSRRCRVVAGTYFYRLIVDGRAVSGKAVVLR